MKFKKKTRILIVLGLIFAVLSIFNNNNRINSSAINAEVDLGEGDNANPTDPKISAFWTVDYIHISNDNWSASGDPWIQVGAGTWDDPHIIENVTINAGGSGNGILIENSNDYFIINNCTVYNSGSGAYEAGIKLEYTNNGTLSNNNCSDNRRIGILLHHDCENNTISGNIVNDNDFSGIRLDDNCENNTISGNTANENSGGIVLYYHCDDNTVSGNIANNNSFSGISLAGYCDNNKISGNTANNNSLNGIDLYIDCNDNTISGNFIKDNQDYGIYIDDPGCQNNLIYYNSLIGNINSHAYDDGTGTQWNNSRVGNYWDNYTGSDGNHDGIGDTSYDWITGSAGSIDNFPLMTRPIHDGDKIHIDDSGVSAWNWSTCADLTEWCTGSGIYSDPYVIDGLEIDCGGTGNGILIENSIVYFVIQNCTITNAGSGAEIKLVNTNNGTLSNNNCSNNGRYGIYLYDDCDNNTISGNTANENDWNGIHLQIDCDNNTISGNTANENDWNGIELNDDCDNNIISGNTVGNVGTPNQDFGIFLKNKCDDNIISGNTANENDWNGIRLQIDCVNNTISGNTANNNSNFGISLENNCENNRVIKNEIKYNDWHGIYIDSSNSSYIFDNNITHNGQTGPYDGGIYLDNAHWNNITGNRITNNTDEGIEFSQSDNNNITGNDIFFNDVGIHVLSFSDNNIIYLNYFRNNTNHAIDDGTDNMWDNGVIGNYWDNHTGPDNDKNCIVDIPYTWIAGSAGSQDNFPLMPCWPPSPPSGGGGGGGGGGDDDDAVEVTIPFGNYYILFAVFSIIALVIFRKRQILYNSRK